MTKEIRVCPHLLSVTCLTVDRTAAEEADVGDMIDRLVIRDNWGQVKT